MMFSSSRERDVCNNTKCQSVMLVPRPGWTCDDGRVAKICNSCYSSFCNGQFCEIHHKELHGWKACRVCSKNIHCGCKVFRDSYLELEDGTIECRDCNRSDDVTPESPNQSLQLDPPLVSNPEKTPDVSPVSVDGSGHVARHAKRRKTEPLPTYRPKITEHEINQVFEILNMKATALFHKVLTSSDVSRVGRLVLPKKSAEAYFPAIDDPEGESIVIKDPNGKHWEFNYRFWPNNNSRMYVLEGFHNFVEASKLEAGDTVIFTRFEPEGKLVLMYQKAKDCYPSNKKDRNALPSSQKIKTACPSRQKPISASPSRPKALTVSPSKPKAASASLSRRKGKMSNVTKSTTGKEVSKDKGKSPMISKTKQPKPNDSVSNEVQTDNVPIVRAKRKSFQNGSTSSHKDVPGTVRPPIIAHIAGATLQWAQCKECFKWRKVPSDVRIPEGWTCSSNFWDQKRSRCSAKEEMSLEKIKNTYLKDTEEPAGSSLKKRKIKHMERKPHKKAVEEDEDEDELAIIPIATELSRSLTQPRMSRKHPRHRSGCRCIVCIQPPSKSKHKSSCKCSRCLTTRGRVLGPRRRKRRATTTKPKAQKIAKTVASVGSDSNPQMVIDGGPKEKKKKGPKKDGSKGKKRPETVHCGPMDLQEDNIPIRPEEMIATSGPETEENTTRSTSGSELKNKWDIDLNLIPDSDSDSMETVQETLIRYVSVEEPSN